MGNPTSSGRALTDAVESLDTFQLYGQIFIMNADGSGKRMITDSLWEHSMPLYIPAALPHGQARR